VTRKLNSGVSSTEDSDEPDGIGFIQPMEMRLHKVYEEFAWTGAVVQPHRNRPAIGKAYPEVKVYYDEDRRNRLRGERELPQWELAGTT
jgi:hypothetical protein